MPVCCATSCSGALMRPARRCQTSPPIASARPILPNYRSSNPSLSFSAASEPVCRGDQGACVGWVEGAVAAIGSDDQVGFGPGTVQGPGALDGTDHIVTTLND